MNPALQQSGAPAENTPPAAEQPPETKAEASHGKVKRAFVSAGERITTFITYAGVDWLFNAAAGVGFAYWGKRTESGKKYWSGPISTGFTKLLSPFIKDQAKLDTSVGRGNMFLSIIAGGMFTLPPLLVLEHRPVKKSITQFFDRMIYGKDKVEHDPKFQQAYAEIEQEPKKDFWTGMYTRFMALAPLLAMVLIPRTAKLSSEYYFDPLARTTKKVAGAVGIKPGPKMTEIPPGQKESNWDYIHDSTAMDFGLGPAYALLHHLLINFFSKLKFSFGKKEPAVEQKASMEIHPPSQDTAAESPSVSHREKYLERAQAAETPSLAR